MEGQEEREAIEVPHRGDLAFSDLMDALAPESEDEGAGGSAAPAGDVRAPVDGRRVETPAGRTEAGGTGDAGSGRPDEARGRTDQGSTGADALDAGGDAGGSPEHGATEPGHGDQEQGWALQANVEPSVVIPQLGNLSNAIEQNLVEGYRSAAFEEMRQQHARYFEALEVHPRMLVGRQVPSLTGEGTETLKDSRDAGEWQEAVKEILVQEVESQANVWMQDATGFMETLHASVDLFKNNPDLIPGTKGFDRRLADEFAKLAKAYEVRIDGKLHGYSVPVQPLIDSLRASAGEKELKAPASAPAPQRRKPSAPQAGIKSKAPTNSEPEDFSTLFGTIGLPQMRI